MIEVAKIGAHIAFVLTTGEVMELTIPFQFEEAVTLRKAGQLVTTALSQSISRLAHADQEKFYKDTTRQQLIQQMRKGQSQLPPPPSVPPPN